MNDAWTRREWLQLGVAAGVGSAVTGLTRTFALPRDETTPASPPAAAPTGLPDRYLESGLAALANGWRNNWSEGHWGAAVIAAWFFAREQALDAATCAALAVELDAFQQQRKELFAFAVPDEEAVPERVPELARSLAEGIGGLRGAGHNVIFAALALKAFRHAPELAKPQWIDALVALDRHLRDHFRPDTTTEYDRAHPLPRWQTPADLFASTFDCWLRNTGAGEVGLVHQVTHADALADLWEAGHEELALRGCAALKLQINLDLPPPASAAAAPSPAESPLTRAFWANPSVRSKTWGFRGHTFKFPFSYWRRRGAIRDDGSRAHCDARALTILGTLAN